MPDRLAFEQLVEPYRGELHVHCYRMLGSLHDAEDVVQESLLRAWRGLDGFEGRSSLRAWLYKIATNTCLNHLRKRPRVVVPAGYAPSADPPVVEVPWLEPYPDRLHDPAEQVSRRMTTSLAFATAVQLLTARQRAVLILRDVLSFSTAEVADLLDTTPAAVDSTLRRARRRLVVDRTPAPPAVTDEDEDRLVLRFVAAWERADIDGLVAMLAEDAILAMPPIAASFRGRPAIREFLATVPAEGRLELIRLRRVVANGQPALAAYAPNPTTGRLEAYGIMVLTIDPVADTITAITGFPDPTLFPAFGLPTTWLGP
jgi:RNA polymerase sigma-70 factor (ECF subfamily)